MSDGVRKLANGLLDALIDRWWLDPILAVGGVGLYAVVTHYVPVLDLLAHLSLVERTTLYGDLMTLSNTMGAGIGVAFTVYVAMTSRGVDQVKALLAERLVRRWIWAFTAPWLASSILIALRATDAGEAEPTNWAHFLALGAVMLVLAACIRVLYVFVTLTGLQHRPPPPPAVRTASRGIGMRQPAEAGDLR